MQSFSRLPRLAVAGLIVLALLGLRRLAVAFQPAPASESPAGAASAAAAPAIDLAAPPVPDAAATQLVQQARERLAQWRSVQARILERVELGGRRLKVQGSYVAGEFPRMRLEFDIVVGDQKGTQLEVCDGQVLHILRTIRKTNPASGPGAAADAESTAGAASPAAGDASLREADKPLVEAIRRDVQQILRGAPNTRSLALPIHAADLGLGGLPAMLASFERSLVFDAVRDEQLDGRTYRVVQGRWKPEFLAMLDVQLQSAAGQIKPFLPDLVRISFDAETLFPARVLYLKRASAESKNFRPMLSLEFRDVVLDGPVPSDAFLHQLPPGVDEVDDTADFLQLLQGPPPEAAGSSGPAGAPGGQGPAESGRPF